MANTRNAYISGPLTGAADLAIARDLYLRLASICRLEGYDTYLPHLVHDPEDHADVPAEEVYQQDLKNLLAADVVVAYVGGASLGVGAELAIAVAHHRPVIAISRPGERVSRFVLGMLRTSDVRELVAPDDTLENALRESLRRTT